VEVYDCNLHAPEQLDALLGRPWDIIGISILADTLRLTLEMFIRVRREQPNALLVAGGPEATLNYQDIFDLSDADVAVLAEGERPILEMADGKPLCDIPGVIHRRRAMPVTNQAMWDYYRDLDWAAMGWPEYWEKNETLGDAKGKNKVVRIVTTTHCNRKGCSFCSVVRIREFACGHRVAPAFLDGKHVEATIERILTQLPEATHIYFMDDTFLPVPSRIGEFCDALARFKGRVKFMVQTDTDRVTREVVRRLADAGVVHVSCGVESCSARLRKIVGKPQNEQRIEDIIGWCKEFGVQCYYLIILFVPESTMEDLRINYRTLTRWQDEGTVSVSVMPYMIPYRGSNMWYSTHEFAYRTFTLSNGKVLKQPYMIYPSDPTVRAVMEKFRERSPEYIERMNREQGHSRQSKNYTGKVYIQLLGDLLREGGYCQDDPHF